MKRLSALVAAAAAAASGAGDKIPLYLYAGPAPTTTVEAQNDDAYREGDVAVVAGRWQKGGTAGGAILRCSVNEPDTPDGGALNAAPLSIRYFYLDIMPPGTPAEGPGDWARARGLIADKGLYAYGYVMRPEIVEPSAAPSWNEDAARAALKELRRRIQRIKLDAITTEPHRIHNKGYKIVADPARAAVNVEFVDYEARVVVVKARLERLPPRDSEVLFRYLDVYLAVDEPTSEVKWAVACVGGFALEQ